MQYRMTTPLPWTDSQGAELITSRHTGLHTSRTVQMLGFILNTDYCVLKAVLPGPKFEGLDGDN